MLWPGQMQLLQRKQTLLIQTKETAVGLPGLQGGIQAGGSCLGAYMVTIAPSCVHVRSAMAKAASQLCSCPAGTCQVMQAYGSETSMSEETAYVLMLVNVTAG